MQDKMSKMRCHNIRKGIFSVYHIYLNLCPAEPEYTLPLQTV